MKKVERRKEENEYKYENEDENEDKYENENEDDDEYEYENEDEDDETMSQNEIKELNGHLIETIDKSKSFEDQIKLIKKVENPKEYYFINNFDDKELKF